MRQSRRHYRSRTHASTAGQEAARRHIEEARQFEREMGGTVSDVKKYFFELKDTELNLVFAAYNRQYGGSKEAYARNVFSRLKSGSTQMSGLVAKRLFDLLPPRMPIAIKLELAGNVWRHFGTSSTHHFTVGPQADAKLVIDSVYETMSAEIQNYNIPQNVKNRFDWLAAGDVSVKEHLLNYFRQMERKIAIDNLQAQLPILQAQMRDHSNHTSSIHTQIEIHKHSVDIWIDPRLDAHFREGQPERQRSASGASGMVWFLIAVAVIVAVIFFLHAGNQLAELKNTELSPDQYYEKLFARPFAQPYVPTAPVADPAEPSIHTPSITAPLPHESNLCLPPHHMTTRDGCQ
jgi:hypothetical protein